MNIILKEQQVLILENNYESWGCNLFPDNSEKKEWCKNAQNKIIYNFSKVQEQIDKIGDHLKNDEEISYREKVKYYMSGDTFFDDNVNNLNLAEELISPTCEKGKKSIDNFKADLSKKFLFVDKINNKFKYSKLTRLNSNYSALAYLLTEFRDRKKLVGNTFKEIFESYFETPTDTLKESPFFNLIIHYFSNKKEAIEIMENVLKTIKGTDDMGRASEEQGFEFLSSHFGSENIKVFSGDFSWPDFLGIDMLINEKDLGWGWVPVQVKTSIGSCRPNRKFCKNICIGKDKSKNYNWDYRIYDGEKELHPSEI
jgi:hypothetical protein